MKYYFLNNALIGFSNGNGATFTNYDAVRENLTNEQLDKISQGYIFQMNEETGEEELVIPPGRQEEKDEKLAQAKKQEANQIIISRYPLRKQININRLGGGEAEEMNARIDAIREEENANGKDADFSSFL